MFASSTMRWSAPLMVLLALIAGGPKAHALDYQLSGFGSVVAGEILTGDDSINTGSTEGPLFIGDWTNGLMYTKKRPMVTPESRVGGQFSLNLSHNFKVVTQAIARAGNHSLNLDWLYLHYDVTPTISFDAGRRRLPIFFYSEFQDIGYAYIWMRPPTELYGWDATNFDGITARVRSAFGAVSFSSSLFGGQANVPKDPFYRIYLTTPVNVQWRYLAGADFELNYRWWTTRAVLIQSRNRYDAGQGWGDAGLGGAGGETEQTIAGLANNFEIGSFFALTELNVLTRGSGTVHYRSPSYSVGAGHHFGKWTPFFNYSHYSETTDTPDTYPNPFISDESTATLRYEVAKSSALKLQYTAYRDLSKQVFNGNSSLVNASYDFTF